MSSIRELLSRVMSAKIYDLEQPRFLGMPTSKTHAPGYAYHLYRRHQDSYTSSRSNQRTGASGLLVMSEHAGTHIDALCHISLDLKMFGNVEPIADVQTPRGFTRLGIETQNPIIARGVLFDIPALKGIDCLPPRSFVTALDLEQFSRSMGVELREGDVALVRTGYGKRWSSPEEYVEAAGVSKDATDWLDSKGVIAVGADNTAWDFPNYVDPSVGHDLYAHVLLISKRGKPIIENVYLEELSADHQYSFVFICAPLKLKGVTASPVRPIALA